MLTEARAQRIRHSFHSLPRTRLNSMDRIEKYTLLLKKEKQVLEKSEKAARLAARCFTTLDEGDDGDLSETEELNTTASVYGTMPRLRRHTDAGRFLSFDGPPPGAWKTKPERVRRSLPSIWFPTPHEEEPPVQWKDRPHSVVITARFQAARDRQDKRRERVKSLNDDCVHAKKILDQIKAISMPTLHESQRAKHRLSRRLSSSDGEHDGIPNGSLVPCKVDIIDC